MLSAIAVSAVLYFFPIFILFFENKITDIKYSVRSMLNQEPDMNSSIVMVNLDDYSKKQSGKPLWPYPDYADVIKKISSGGPTSIGIDFILANTIDTSGWNQVVSAMADSFLAINPYMIKMADFGDSQKPIELASHQDILYELRLDELPQVESGK
ncbi:MAG: CHASE2 domain-containing protein, partial [Candidatus Thalassarchaeum sp.]|nr:CHASE2 domain-containing protein [Candidatus Thalassarchaeum sp.]